MDNPHDKRYKELFSNKKSFLSLLKDCIREPWVDELDENNIRKSNSSFILPDFSEMESDIVYEATINGRRIIFYILLELQSTVDFRMPYRLLLYIMAILRDYYIHADENERDNKDFKFPAVFPIVFYSGSGTWTVPLNIRDMFYNSDMFGKYILSLEYMLVNVKDYKNTDVSRFSSKLLGLILLLENTKNDVEFYSQLRQNIHNTVDFDNEELRIFNVLVKLMDKVYGYNKGDEIEELINNRQVQEADTMLCDIIENAKLEKEQLLAQGRLEDKLETAQKMFMEKLPVDLILRITGLSREQLAQVQYQ